LEETGIAESVWTMEMMRMPTWTSLLAYAFAFMVLSYAKEGRNERVAMDGYNLMRRVSVFVRTCGSRIFKKVKRTGDN